MADPIKFKLDDGREVEFEDTDKLTAFLHEQVATARTTAAEEERKKYQAALDVDAFVQDNPEAQQFLNELWDKKYGKGGAAPAAVPANGGADPFGFVDEDTPEAKAKLKEYLRSLETQTAEARQLAAAAVNQREVDTGIKRFDDAFASARNDQKYKALSDDHWNAIKEQAELLPFGIAETSVIRQADNLAKWLGSTADGKRPSPETLPGGLPLPTGASATTGGAGSDVVPKTREEGLRLIAASLAGSS